MTLASNGNEIVESKPFESKFPIVGIAASAGGLAAFTQLMSHLAVDTGMAFLLIQHLEPDRQSLLSELLVQDVRYPKCRCARGLTAIKVAGCSTGEEVYSSAQLLGTRIALKMS